MDIHIKESAKRFKSHCPWDRVTGEEFESATTLFALVELADS